ncbi:MAG: triose-phosphate isomerase [Nanobdellota archaeon]
MVIIAANWKEHKTNEETIKFLEKLNQEINDTNSEIIIAPSFVALKDAKEHAGITKIAAQNMFYQEQGAFTGEVSPKMIKSFCDYVILGHSERRGLFYETDKDVNKKAKKALEYEIKPIICIGETKKQRDEGKASEIITSMLKKCLEGITEPNFVIAYEPVWAISGGDCSKKPATPQDAQEMHNLIRKELSKLYQDKSQEIHIIYGGSVKPENISKIMAQKDVDGVLVGGCSLETESFVKIINYQ